MTQKLGYPKFDLVSYFVWGLGVVGKKSTDSIQKMAERMDSRQKELVASLEACTLSGGREDASQREGITGVWHDLDFGSAYSNVKRSYHGNPSKYIHKFAMRSGMALSTQPGVRHGWGSNDSLDYDRSNESEGHDDAVARAQEGGSTDQECRHRYCIGDSGVCG